MTDPDLPDFLRDLDLARLLLSQERQRRVALQIDLLARQHADALRERRIAGAGLDVAPVEPLPADHPLWMAPNVIMTPHTAGASQFRIPRNLDRFCRNLAHFRAGEPLEGLINKTRGF